MIDDTFFIEESDLAEAKSLCDIRINSISNECRIANFLATKLAVRYFENYEIDINSGLHNIDVFKDKEILDIYLNNAYIDIRLYFEGEELFLPKLSFEKQIVPYAYMFMRLNSDLSEAQVTGFITPDNVDLEDVTGDYIQVKESMLQTFEEIKHVFDDVFVSNMPYNFELDVHNFLDGNLQDEYAFLQLLLTSKTSREYLFKALKAKKILQGIQFTEEKIVEEPCIEVSSNNNEDILELVEDNVSREFNETPDLTDNLDKATDSEFFNDESVGVSEEIILLKSDENSEIFESYNVDLINNDNMEQEPELLESSAPEELIDFGADVVDLIEESNQTFEADLSYNTMITPSIDSIEAEECSQDLDYENVNLDFVDTENSSTLSKEEEFLEVNILDENNQEFEQDDITPQIEFTDIEDIVDVEEDSIQESDVSEDADFDNVISANSEISESDEIDNDIESISEIGEINSEYEISIENNEIVPDLEELFEQQDSNKVLLENTVKDAVIKRTTLLPILGTLVILAGLGYYSYTKLVSPNREIPPVVKTEKPRTQSKSSIDKEKIPMPNETIENETLNDISNEAIPVSIPAIEQNLNTSVQISNLSVKWEVPTAYTNSVAAKKYLTKVGKIIQLNLKTELLLLSKPPIFNKVVVELEFNKDSQRFELKNVLTPSGEKDLDDLITRTIKSTLDRNLNINIGSLGNISGNPLLVIKL